MASSDFYSALVADQKKEKVDRSPRDMNQLLTWLSGGDLRSDGMANEAAQFVLVNPQVFEDLFAGLFDPDDVIRGRTADALEKISRERPDLIIGYLQEMVDIAENDQVPMVKMHLAMIFGHLAVYENSLEQLISALFDLLADESVFTRSWAIVSLCIVGRKYQQECQRIVNRLSQLQGDQSVAIRSRIKKALIILTEPNAHFPNGWIKSEQLQGI
jgi:HEAT repeat protein